MKKFIPISILFVIALYSISCNKTEDFITDASAKLSFSLDTLHFDTVFTELGSATYSFKVYNEHKQPIRINNMHIEGNTASHFRMNVDGIAGNSADAVEIWPNDSIYVFVEVTINPDAPVSASPFILYDKVLFETNGNKQEVILEAWGQNAVYLPSRFNKGVPVTYTCDNGEWVWDDPRPYVLYGEVFIDECLLRIPAGTHIYIHGGIAQNETFGIFNDGIIYILENGKLQIDGTTENPVIIEGDRLEPDFNEETSQWFGIFLGKNSTGNIINHAIIKNSTFGFYVDSLAQVEINNSQFFNTGSSGLIAYHSTVDATNSLFYNNGGNSVDLRFGGNYTFNHCTLANYGADAAAMGMSNHYCLERDAIGQCLLRKKNPLKVNLNNCILTGSRSDQIIFSDIEERGEPFSFSVNMQNCIVKVDKLLTTTQDGLYADFFETYCSNCINPANDDALFLDRTEDDYHLDTLSIAIDKGLNIPSITLDLEDNARDGNVDIGCFEYQQ